MGLFSWGGKAVGTYFGGVAGGQIGEQIGGYGDKYFERGLNKGFDAYADKLLTSERSPAEEGAAANAYLANAYPGTNPWERLGSSSPTGPLEIARKNVQTQRRNVSLQTRTLEKNTKLQTRTQSRVADVHGRAAAVTAAAQYGPGAVSELGDYVTTGKHPNIAGHSVQQRDSFTRQAMKDIAGGKLDLERAALDLKIGVETRDPATAALMRLAVTTWREAGQNVSADEWIADHMNELRILGGAKEAIAGLGTLLRGFMGRVKILGGRGAKGGPMSAPGKVIPPQPKSTGKRKFKGNYAPDTPENRAFNARLRKHRTGSK